MGKVRVRDKILEYYDLVLKKNPTVFTLNKDANTFVMQNSTAYLFACILDQGAVAERIWAMPYHLRMIWGHLEPVKIADMTDDELYKVFQELPSKPRYWKTAARRLKSAAILLVNRYKGDAANIWNDNPRAGDLQARLDSFEGVGQKKAAMATRILAMDLGVPMRNWEEIDVAVDDLVMRVFPRTGLSMTSSPMEIIEAARQLNPMFPGALDYPCWMIGRQWCQPKMPNCSLCYIGSECPKIGV